MAVISIVIDCKLEQIFVLIFSYFLDYLKISFFKHKNNLREHVLSAHMGAIV